MKTYSFMNFGSTVKLIVNTFFNSIFLTGDISVGIHDLYHISNMLMNISQMINVSELDLSI